MAVDVREPAAETVVAPDAIRQEEDTPIRPRSFGLSDAGVLAGSALSAFSLLWLLFYRVVPLSGAAGFVILWFALFLGIYYVVDRELEGPVVAKDRVMAAVVGGAAVALAIPLTLIIGYVVVKGIGGLTFGFFTQTLQFVGPLDPATAGGAAHAIVGTLEQVAMAVLIAVPLGVTCAVFLNEVGGPLRRPVRIFVDAMSGVPTIVAGLFIFAFWIVGLGHGFSGFAATLAISVSMLPTITRTAEEVLRLVPDGLREASYALGSGEWRTTKGVVLPTAKSGLVTAVILGVARAIGETAPLIMTAFGSSIMNANPFSGAQDSLPLFVFRQIRQPEVALQQRAWAGALVLILIVLGLFVLARFYGNRTARKGRLRRAPERVK